MKEENKSLKTETFRQTFQSMLSYCFKCRKNTESKNPKTVKGKNGRTMLLSKCVVFDSKM